MTDTSDPPRKPGATGKFKPMVVPPTLTKAEEALRLADVVSPTAPPAQLAPERDLRTGTLSVRMTNDSLNRLVAESRKTGKTQRVLIAEALVAIGLDIGPVDLENRPPVRRGG